MGELGGRSFFGGGAYGCTRPNTFSSIQTQPAAQARWSSLAFGDTDNDLSPRTNSRCRQILQHRPITTRDARARPVTFISTSYSTKPRITLASKSTARTIEAWVAAACVGFDWDAGSSYEAIILKSVRARSISSCRVSRKVSSSRPPGAHEAPRHCKPCGSLMLCGNSRGDEMYLMDLFHLRGSQEATSNKRCQSAFTARNGQFSSVFPQYRLNVVGWQEQASVEDDGPATSSQLVIRSNRLTGDRGVASL